MGTKTREDKNSNKGLLLGPLFILFGLVLMAFVFLSKPSVSSKSQSVSQADQKSVSHDERVNYHLQDLERRRLGQKIQIQLANPNIPSRLSVEDKGHLKEKFLTKEPEVRFDQERVHTGLIEESELSDEGLAEQIRLQLKEIKTNEEYRQAYKEAYAREFVENARRSGLEITLDDNFEVISVQRIRQPSGYRSPNSLQEGAPSGLQ